MKVSEAREEKNLQDAKAEYQSGSSLAKKKLKIKYFEYKIEEEKKAIKDCLDQNFFSMAKSKIERIEEMRNKINSLR